MRAPVTMPLDCEFRILGAQPTDDIAHLVLFKRAGVALEKIDEFASHLKNHTEPIWSVIRPLSQPRVGSPLTKVSTAKPRLFGSGMKGTSLLAQVFAGDSGWLGQLWGRYGQLDAAHSAFATFIVRFSQRHR